MTPIFELINFPLSDGSTKTVRIGKHISTELQIKQKALLTEYQDMFAWQTKDLGIVSRDLAENHLGILDTVKPIILKQWFLVADQQEAIKKEVSELLEADIIRPRDYPTWVSK